MKLRYTPRATADVEAIAGYVVLRHPEAAVRIERAIRTTIGLLVDHPQLGRARPHLGCRSLGGPNLPYTIYYRLGDDEIAVLHIRDDRRRPLLEGEM